MIRSACVPRSLCSAGGQLAMSLLAVIILALLPGVSSASANVQSFEVDAYQQALDIPSAVAREDLKVQAEGAEADLVGDLESRLGENFAGIWFDPGYGEYVVPVASDTAGAVVGEVMAAAQLKENYRTHIVKYSWGELQAAHNKVDASLREFFDANLIYTSLDPRTNAVVVHVASAVDARKQVALNQLANGMGDEVELRASRENAFQGSRDACSNVVPNCGSPLRGGVEIGPWKQPYGGTCTAAFRAIGVNGQKYLLSAGHCAAEKNPSNPILSWQARDEQKLPVYGQAKYLGEVEQLAFPTHDWMKINVTGSAWDLPLQSWPSLVAYWGKGSGVAGQPPIDAEYVISGEASSVVGQGVCHSGIASGGSCGQVVETNVSFNFGEQGNVTYDLVKVKNACSEGGDSGGPWFASNVAYGIHIGKTATLAPCGSSVFYEEITDATEALGVTVGPGFSPQTETNAATAIGSLQATLNGSVNPRGLLTTYHFEWGTTASYGQSGASFSIGAGEGANAVRETINQLSPNTTYHYRVVATNSLGTAYGSDRAFTTETAAVFADAVAGNTISNWNVGSGTGWQQAQFYGHTVDRSAPAPEPSSSTARPTSSSSTLRTGTRYRLDDLERRLETESVLRPHGRRRHQPLSRRRQRHAPRLLRRRFEREHDTDWNTASGGWQQTQFYGHTVAPGTSPSAVASRLTARLLRRCHQRENALRMVFVVEFRLAAGPVLRPHGRRRHQSVGNGPQQHPARFLRRRHQ